MTSARLDPALQTESFLKRGIVSWTYVLVDARGLRVIEIDEAKAKKELGDTAAVDAIIALAEKTIEVSFTDIEQVRCRGLGTLLTITHAGKELDVYTDTDEQAERLFALLADRTSLRRTELEGTFLDAAGGAIAAIILTVIGGGILYMIAANATGDTNPHGRNRAAKGFALMIADTLGTNGILAISGVVLALAGLRIAQRLANKPRYAALV
jgi:hypothetical protein